MPQTLVFSDLSEKGSNMSNATLKKGCFVRPVHVVLICLLVAVIATAVGLIVYYTHPSRNIQSEQYNGDTTTQDAVTTAELTSQPPTSYPTDVLLPTSLTPYSYSLSLRPDFYSKDPEKFTFNGTVEVFFNVNESTSVITLHKRLLDIDQNSLVVRSVDDGKLVSLGDEPSYDASREFYKVHTADQLTKGVNYSVVLAFRGNLASDLKGIYYSSYEVDGDVRYLSTSQLQPTDARKTFPCMDEPALKATFDVVLERKNSVQAWSNGEIKNTVHLEGDWEADHFTQTPRMSTYLLAFVIADFKCRNTTTKTGTLVEVCSRPTAVDQTEFAVSLAGDMQEFYEKYHDIAYPLPKTVHMAVPDFAAGAMENWGLILYRETALLYDSIASSAANKQRVASVMAHELAHMWFGNLVTPNWWDDIWLNEGFASFMQVKCVHNSLPSWEMDSQFLATRLQTVFRMDSLTSSHPVYQPVYHPAEISEIFDSITYNKGSSVIRMINTFLGEKTFRWGMADYLKDNKYGVVRHKDLFDALSSKAVADNKTIDVQRIMDTWLLQLGYPVVEFQYNKGSGKIHLSQKHFLLDPSKQVTQPSEFNYVWRVPISFKSSNDNEWNTEPVGWLNNETGLALDVDKSAGWIIGNVKQAFYYRVNYDYDNWLALIDQLKHDHTLIHVNNRAQIIDDLFNLGRAGEVDLLLGMNATAYLDKETHYVPWKAAHTNINYISNMFQLSANYGSLQKYMQLKLDVPHTTIGWQDNPDTDSHLDQLLRVVVLDLSCKFGLDNCLLAAVEQFAKWQNETSANRSNPISQNLRPVAYCAAIGQGGEQEWDFAFSQFRESNSGSEKRNLLEALACASKTWLLQRYLDLSISGAYIRRQDIRTVIKHVARNPVGRSLAWDFFRANWRNFLQMFGDQSFTLSSIVREVTESFSTPWELKELSDFMEENPNQASARRTFEQAIEQTTSNIAWRNTHETRMADWLSIQI